MSSHWVTDSPHTRRIANGSTYKSATSSSYDLNGGLGSRLFIYGILSWCPTRRGCVLEQEKNILYWWWKGPKYSSVKMISIHHFIVIIIIIIILIIIIIIMTSRWKKWQIDESRLDSKTSLRRKIVPTVDFEAEALERVFVFRRKCRLPVVWLLRLLYRSLHSYPRKMYQVFL